MKIPKPIDDYNLYMGGVDRSDQLRSYYATKLRCRRTWMPQMLFCMNLAVTNSYVIHKGRPFISSGCIFTLRDDVES